MNDKRAQTMVSAGLLCLALGGCATQIGDARGQLSAELSAIETEVRSTRIEYQQRMDRIASEWICTGMSWPTLHALAGSNQDIIDAIMRACAERTFPVSAAP